jgi:excinuclease ABC subunit B
MYADNLTESMQKAIAETERRRQIQQEYNQNHGITPQPIVKTGINSILAFLDVSRRLHQDGIEAIAKIDFPEDLPLEEIPNLVNELETQMKEAAQKLEFEEAAKLRDRIKHLREKMLGH